MVKKPKTIVEDGRRFTREDGRPYYYNSSLRTYLHRYLWEKENGKIPEGFEIHHKDHNPYNNEIDNLELMSSDEHKEYHNTQITDEMREWRRNNVQTKAMPKAIEWHKTKEGKAWHKQHYEQMKERFNPIRKFDCQQCGEEFETEDNGKNKFCSNNCKSAWRRKQGLDNVKRPCIICGHTFIINKYSKTKTCSNDCKTILRRKNKEASK